MANVDECCGAPSGAYGTGYDDWIDERFADLNPLPLRR
jgi:hypothetical protein